MPENRNPDGSSKKPESFESQFKRRVVKPPNLSIKKKVIIGGSRVKKIVVGL